MARLRFPGRPGHRFGRLGVSYGQDEIQNDEDASIKLTANINRGLRAFREIFGESDEVLCSYFDRMFDRAWDRRSFSCQNVYIPIDRQTLVNLLSAPFRPMTIT